MKETSFKSDLSSLNALRTLVFIETEPQSNIYKQVLLDTEHFMDMTQSISTYKRKTLQTDIEEVEVELSEETYVLPDLQDIYIN